jgi:uncharacterized protein
VQLFPRLSLGRLTRALAVPLMLGLACVPALAQDTFPPGAKLPAQFPRTKLRIGMYLIDAAVADNPADQEQGLMYRTKLGPNEGMIFIFNDNAVHCFWMKNTLIPLSVAFIRGDGTITDLDEMKPETLDNHCSTHNVDYVLEMPKGWFTSKGIKPGMQVERQ